MRLSITACIATQHAVVKRFPAMFPSYPAFHDLQVHASVQKGITEMAKHNLEQEQLISEVKNHIAIVRSAHIYRKQAKFVYCKEGLRSC